MLYFAVAYLGVWIAAVGYLAWLGSNQRRLERIVDALEADAPAVAPPERHDTRAA